jgi:hypothetical protein
MNRLAVLGRNRDLAQKNRHEREGRHACSASQGKRTAVSRPDQPIAAGLDNAGPSWIFG